uniref:GOLD domain-containing protein n=1 Tax=Strombidium inclinatum TaxID=197538 RepID=A0A7S3IW45_9SPIT|mmetsp:Transcript_39577/g.60514  ORF Transcript_39577/g.60514 Transcript_39577/m.60514 type:complete len:239 (+) Transcript_39577:33-749(+)
MKYFTLVAATIFALVQHVQGIYFYLEKNQEKCFKDEVVKNYTLEMTINILDKDITDYYDRNLQKQKDGINLFVLNSDGKQLYNGVVWPNEQYEYDADKGGEYKVCVSMTDSMFDGPGVSQIKTQVKFASEFHRDKKAAKSGEEVHHAEKKKEEADQTGLKQGHFAPIRKRINKIYKKILDIKQFQNYEREQEEMYEANQKKLASNFFWLSLFQIAVVVGSAAYSVWNLKKYFVKKAIY